MIVPLEDAPDCMRLAEEAATRRGSYEYYQRLAQRYPRGSREWHAAMRNLRALCRSMTEAHRAHEQAVRAHQMEEKQAGPH